MCIIFTLPLAELIRRRSIRPINGGDRLASSCSPAIRAGTGWNVPTAPSIRGIAEGALGLRIAPALGVLLVGVATPCDALGDEAADNAAAAVLRVLVVVERSSNCA